VICDKRVASFFSHLSATSFDGFLRATLALIRSRCASHSHGCSRLVVLQRSIELYAPETRRQTALSRVVFKGAFRYYQITFEPFWPANAGCP
jgi:hypothetical protein